MGTDSRHNGGRKDRLHASVEAPSRNDPCGLSENPTIRSSESRKATHLPISLRKRATGVPELGRTKEK
jgi:hypothetical protein